MGVRVRWGCAYINIEIQKGKIAMARKKWAKDFSATTACTVRLIDQLNISEIGELTRPQRCVFADSWFAVLLLLFWLCAHILTLTLLAL